MAGMAHPRVSAAFIKYAGRANWDLPRHSISAAGTVFPYGKDQLEALLAVLGNADPQITGDDPAAQMLSAVTQHDLITKRGWNILEMVCALADRFPSAQIPAAELADILTEARDKTDDGQQAAAVRLVILATAGKTAWQEAAKTTLGEQFVPIFSSLYCALSVTVPDAMTAHNMLPSTDDSTGARRMAHLIDTVLLPRDMIQEDNLGFTGVHRARDRGHWP